MGTDSGKIAWYSGSDSGDSVPALTSEGYLYFQSQMIQFSDIAPSVWDYNDDGLEDLVIAHYNDEEGYISYLENNGPSALLKFSEPVPLCSFWGEIFFFAGEEPEAVSDPMTALTGSPIFSIQANPASGSLLSFTICVTDAENARLHIYDLSGRLMST